MMVTTHVLVGLVAAAPLTLLFPDHAPLIAASAAAGGLVPDLDLLVGLHRKTFHYPVFYWPAAACALALALVTGNSHAVALGVILLSAAVHATSDVLGGGLEREPWKQTTDKAVYCHARQTWLAPRHYIAYDGSPGDFAATVIAGVVVAWAYSPVGFIRPLLIASLIVGVGYVAIRKHLPAVEDALNEHVPMLHPLLAGLHGGDE